MYSWEIEEFIKNRDYYIGGDDLSFIINTNFHPQINYIKYDAFNHTYTMTTNDNYHFFFEAMPIIEAEKRGLFKELKKTFKS